MDFLLSYRTVKAEAPLDPLTAIQNTYLNRNAKINFWFLSVDNRLWKNSQVIGTLLRFMLTTYSIIFVRLEAPIRRSFYLNKLLDLFYLVDFVSALIYRYKWPKQNTNPEKLKTEMAKLIWRNALFKPRKIWMLTLDLVSLLPLDITRIWIPPTSIAYVLVECLPVLRMYRIFLYYVENCNRIFLGSTQTVELILKIAVLWIFLSHVFTCAYYYLAVITNSGFLKVAVETISFNASNPFDWYILNFYLNQFSMGNIGYGDIPPASDSERLLVTVSSILGFSLINGYIVAALSSALSEKIRKLATLRLRISLMKSEMGNRRVPEEAITKIEKFYNSLWVLRKGVGSEVGESITLSDALWNRINCDIYVPALNASLLFRSCDAFSKRAIAQIMETNLYMAGDTILKRREINSQMFYVSKGAIELMSYQDDETDIVRYGAGSVFGQFALLLSIPVVSEIHAATFCEIHTIKRKKLFSLLWDYPKAKEIIFTVHKNLLMNVLADKFKATETHTAKERKNVLQSNLFYKVPLEASRIAQNDICVVSTCPFVFEPDTVYMVIWNTMVTLLVVTICFYYPYCAAFSREYPKKAEPLVILCDLILTINLYISFSTAFTKENVLLSSLREIITDRLKKPPIYVDIIAVLPIHYFIDDDSRAKPVILCLRCLELYKINYFFKRTETVVAVKMVWLLRLMKYILYFFLLDYIGGITYYLEACYTEPCIANSWYPNNNASALSKAPIWTSMYAVILIISGTGYGDLTPKNLLDMVFVILFSVVGAFLFIYLISEYSANLSLLGEPKRNFIDLADRIKVFLIRNKMLSSVKIRVREFLNLQWERNQGYEFTNDKNLFYDTPPHLLLDINQYTKSRGIQNVKLFKDSSVEARRAVLAQSYRKVLPPHEVVTYAGEVCNAFILIEEGFCEIIYGKDGDVKKIVGPGTDLCTLELLLGITSLCNIRTLTHCTVLKIRREHIMGALKSDPFEIQEFTKLIEDFKKNPIVQEIKKTPPVRLQLMVRSSVKKSVFRFRHYRKGVNVEYTRPFLKLGLCNWIRLGFVKATILPYGKLLKIWELSRCVFAFLSAMIFPLLPYFQLEAPSLYYIGYILDGAACIDLYFRAHVGYYNRLNVLVSHPLSTCARYIKGNFALDFLCSFPFDRFMFRKIYDSSGRALVSTRSINFLRMLRVLQIYRIPTTVINLGDDVLSPPSLFRVLIMMITLTIVFLSVLTSGLILYCINYSVDRSGNYEMVVFEDYSSHFRDFQEIYNLTTDPISVYFVNFYWVTQTAVSLGFGDITARHNTDLMIFVIILIVLSYLYLSYVTLVIASYLSRIDMNLTIYQKRMQSLIKFLKAENVEPLLRKHTINHFEYSWDMQKGMKTQSVIRNFNVALKHDVLLYFYEKTLKNVGAFINVDPTLQRALTSHVEERHFISGATIYKTGDIISDFYVVHIGEVILVGKNEDETVALGPSMIFGHLEIGPRGIAKFSAVATKNVTVLNMKTTDLYSLCGFILSWTDDQKAKEQKKLKQALIKSNEHQIGNKKFATIDYKNSIQYLTYKYSPFIMIFYMILSFFSINEVSYNVAFGAYSVAFAFVLVPVEIMFILKIFLGFNTGFLDETGEFISDRTLIRRRYQKLGGLYLDVFTVIPFEFFGFAFHKKNRLYAISLFRVTKFLRAHNIQCFFNMKIETLSVNMVFVKMTAVIVWTSTLLHQCTCFWYFISCPRAHCPDSLTWQKILGGGDFHNHYLNSLYFVALVLTSTGLGDVIPHTIIEFFCVDLLSLLAFFYTAIFIGQIISTVQKYFLAKRNYEYAISAVRTYLHVNNVPSETEYSVLRYIENIWQNENGQEIPELLKKAPPYLINEIKQSTYGHHIHENPVFQPCNFFFRKHIISELMRKVFYCGDVIVNEEEVNRTMYFVHLGVVRCRYLSGEYGAKVYGKDTFFGLKQGVLMRQPYAMTFIAETTSVILSLTLEKWSYLSEFYPDDVKYIQEQASNNKWV